MIRFAPLLLAACAPPAVRTATPFDLFDGGDDQQPSTDRVLRGTLTADTSLDASAPWVLDGLVFVGDATHEIDLVIDPGTVIYGNPSTRGTLVVSRGSRIIADGTASAPIVFTSPRARGARAAGDWGGLVIDGRAPVNGCATAPCEVEGEGSSGLYGGDDPDDDSGTLRYVRIEFAGALYTPEDELNGLALQGVGRGTTIDHLQLHVTADDGIEFFGGTVDVRHVLVTGAHDDSFDWTFGWSGRAQYVALQQQVGVGDHGLEADNNEADYDAVPRSHPTIANLTLVGQPESSGLGVLLRRGTGVSVWNSLLTGFATGVDVVDDATWVQAYDTDDAPTGGIEIQGTWLDCAAAYGTGAWGLHTVGSLLGVDYSTNVLGDPGIVSPADEDTPDFRLDASSAALAGALPVPGAFFEPTTYAGAFDAETDWTAGWTVGGTN